MGDHTPTTSCDSELEANRHPCWCWVMVEPRRKGRRGKIHIFWFYVGYCCLQAGEKAVYNTSFATFTWEASYDIMAGFSILALWIFGVDNSLFQGLTYTVTVRAVSLTSGTRAQGHHSPAPLSYGDQKCLQTSPLASATQCDSPAQKKGSLV